MKPHFENEEEVTIKQMHSAESQLNTHAQMWCDILRIGHEAGASQSSRIKKAVVVNQLSVPGLGGFRKDHKLDMSTRSREIPVDMYLDPQFGPSRGLSIECIHSRKMFQVIVS